MCAPALKGRHVVDDGAVDEPLVGGLFGVGGKLLANANPSCGGIEGGVACTAGSTIPGSLDLAE